MDTSRNAKTSSLACLEVDAAPVRITEGTNKPSSRINRRKLNAQAVGVFLCLVWIALFLDQSDLTGCLETVR